MSRKPGSAVLRVAGLVAVLLVASGLAVGALAQRGATGGGEPEAEPPQDRALAFLLGPCRPEGTYLVLTCSPLAGEVSPVASGITASALVDHGRAAEARVALLWVLERQLDQPLPLDRSLPPGEGHAVGDSAYTGAFASTYDAHDGQPTEGAEHGQAATTAAVLLGLHALWQAEGDQLLQQNAGDALVLKRVVQAAEFLMRLRLDDGRFARSPIDPMSSADQNAQVALALQAAAEMVEGWRLEVKGPASASTLESNLQPSTSNWWQPSTSNWQEAAEQALEVLRGERQTLGPIGRRAPADYIWGGVHALVDEEVARGQVDRLAEVGLLVRDWGVRARASDTFIHPSESFDWASASLFLGDVSTVAPVLSRWIGYQRPDGGFPEAVNPYTGRAHDRATSDAAARFLLAMKTLAQHSDEPPAPPPSGLADPTEPVNWGFDILLDYHVHHLEPRVLLDAAWERVRAALAAAGVEAPTQSFTEPDREASWEVFAESLREMVRAHDERVDSADLIEAALRGMAAIPADCHTGYYPDLRLVMDEFHTVREEIGIGAFLLPGLVVKEVLAGSPAEAAGLRRGDTLLEVNAQQVSGAPVDRAEQLLAGPRGSQVRLVVRRPGEPAPLSLVATREPFVEPIAEGRVLQPEIGYLRLRRFTDDLESHAAPVVRELAEQGVQRLVIDLRGNVGGSVEGMRWLLGSVAPGLAAMHRQDRETFRTFDGRRNEVVFDGPVAVLVDSWSASASELVAAAVREYELGRVFGQHTWGCVAEGVSYQLPDGSGIQITTARLLTGREQRDLDGVGLEPEVQVGETTRPVDLAAGRDGPLDAAVEYLLGAQLSRATHPSPLVSAASS